MSDAAEADHDGTLRVAWQISMVTLDPLRNGTRGAVAYNLPTYDALIYRTPEGEFDPGLAQSWEYSDDGLEFRLELQPVVTFHDGSKLDAGVVKANIERLMAMTDSPVFNDIAIVESRQVQTTVPVPVGHCPN